MTLLERLKNRLPPYPQHLGMVLTVAEPDRLVAEFTVREDLSNGLTPAHGGALMTLADTLGAIATVINMPPGAQTTTLESKTHVLAPAPVGTKVIGETTPLHRGRRTQIWETRITNEAGKLIAKITQTQLIL